MCPWNKFAQAGREAKLAARDALRAPKLAELARLDDARFRALFTKSGDKRTGRDRFVRNVLIAIGNSGDAALVPEAQRLLDDASPLVRGAAVWALSRLMEKDEFASDEARGRRRDGQRGVAGRARMKKPVKSRLAQPDTRARPQDHQSRPIPDVVENVKWRKPSNPAGVPVWEHDGIICTGETYKDKVKLTFAKGAALKDPASLFNSSLDGNVRRAIDIREGDKINETALKALVREAVALNTAWRGQEERRSAPKTPPPPPTAARCPPAATAGGRRP